MAEVRMYTRDRCGYCTAAKGLLDGKQVRYEEIDCTGNDDIRPWLRAKTGQGTLPQIFINGTPIGGFNELRALSRTGALDTLLAQEPGADDDDDADADADDADA